MEKSWSKRILIQFGLALWALTTFLLAITSVLLYWKVIDLGTQTAPSPATAASGISAPPPQPAEASPAGHRDQSEKREVQIWCFNPETGGLTARSVTLECSALTEVNCRRVLNALLEPAPADSMCRSPFPPETRVRGLYLQGKEELVVDFSGDITRMTPFAGGCALWESAMIRCLALTLSNPQLRGRDDTVIRRVRVLVDGALPGNEFPAHLDLSEAIDIAQAVAGTGESP